MNTLYPPQRSADGSITLGNKVRQNPATSSNTPEQPVLIPDTKSGTPGSDAVKIKGVITWVGVNDAVPAELRLYDRLFVEAHPEAGGKDFLENQNTNSLKVMRAVVEQSLAAAKADDKFQFERHGYFVADRVDHGVGRPVFNLAVWLKDSWVR